MKRRIIYSCDVCGTDFDEEADAAACEALGAPEVPAWLLARVGGQAAVFLSNGALASDIVGIGKPILRYGREHCATVRERVAENVIIVNRFVTAFDPMVGADYLRRVPDDELFAEMDLWVMWCLKYGIEPDISKAQWFSESLLGIERAKLVEDGVRAAIEEHK